MIQAAADVFVEKFLRSLNLASRTSVIRPSKTLVLIAPTENVLSLVDKCFSMLLRK